MKEDDISTILNFKESITIAQTENNRMHIKTIKKHVQHFKATIRQSDSRCYILGYNKLFGTVDQNTLLLKKNSAGF